MRHSAVSKLVEIEETLIVPTLGRSKWGKIVQISKIIKFNLLVN